MASRLPWCPSFLSGTRLLRFTASHSPVPKWGGDLIDVIERNGNLLVYIADVSGHGLAAVQLMGMLKTAIRVSLQFRRV
jgi:serine phosphatase RsbU (regulator of sigma subunit)